MVREQVLALGPDVDAKLQVGVGREADKEADKGEGAQVGQAGAVAEQERLVCEIGREGTPSLPG